MKKNLILGAMALTAIATVVSCTNEEIVEMPISSETQIGFKAFSPNLTRGTTINNEGDLRGTTFDIHAFKGTTPYMGIPTDGVMIKYTSGWDYDKQLEKSYWTTSEADALDFYAISPATPNTPPSTVYLTKSITDESQTITYTADPLDPINHIDVMYDVVKGAWSGDRNGTATGVLTTGGLPLNFKHILSNIVFKAKSNSNNLKIIINELTLHNVIKKGTYTIDAVPSPWVVSTDAGDLSNFVYKVGGKTVANDEQVVDLTSTSSGSFILVPQTLTKWSTASDNKVSIATADANKESYIAINCKIINTAGGDSQLFPATGDFGTVYVPFGLALAPSTRYTYTIVFGNSTGGNGGGGLDEEGNPILDQFNITFNPDVDKWDNQTGDAIM